MGVRIQATLMAMLLSTCMAAGLRGEYDMSWGHMTFTSNTFARYEGGESFITGWYNWRSKTLNGFWVEPHSNRRCNYKRDGSYYWGRFRFVFDRDLNFFMGSWEYCDKAVTGHEHTIGHRKIAKNLGTWFGRGAVFSASYGDIQFYSRRTAYFSGGYFTGWFNKRSGVFQGRFVHTWRGHVCAKKGPVGASKWGRFRFVFDKTRTHFKGTWAYCADEPLSGSWNGKRILR